MSEQGEHGEWIVCSSCDGTSVVIEFNVLGESGVEVFTTSMPPASAVEFAKALMDKVLECEESDDD